MSELRVGHEDLVPIQLFYRDEGAGNPVVMVHGWPLANGCWDRQRIALLGAGKRVICYDRRGYGASSRTTAGLDVDTYAEDLHLLLRVLDLHDVTLVGHGCGVGEVLRYLGTYGEMRIRGTVLIGSMPPSRDAWDPRLEIEGVRRAFAADRRTFLARLLEVMYTCPGRRQALVSASDFRRDWRRALDASVGADLRCLDVLAADYRDDMDRIDVPTLVIHGDSDRVFPIGIAGDPLCNGIPRSRLVVVADGPHGLLATHAALVNAELLTFIG